MEDRIALRAIKHIVVNSAIVTRIIAHADAPQWKTVAQYRARVNKLCPPIPVFTMRLSEELAKKALRLRVAKQHTAAAPGAVSVSISTAEVKEVQEQVKDHFSKKRKRVVLLESFNNGPQLKVRLDTSLRHYAVKIGSRTLGSRTLGSGPNTGKEVAAALTCIVCGGGSAAKRCNVCGVPLHVHNHKGQTKDCFFRFHNNKRLDLTPSRKNKKPDMNDN